MIRVMRKFDDGSPCLKVTPETEEEDAVIERLERAGLFDCTEGFADQDAKGEEPWPPADPGMTREEAIEALKLTAGEYWPQVEAQDMELVDAVFGPEAKEE